MGKAITIDDELASEAGAFVAVPDHLDSTPRVLGVFDRPNNLLDDDLEPCNDTRARVREMVPL